jgi:hypothetical protein
MAERLLFIVDVDLLAIACGRKNPVATPSPPEINIP